MSGPEHLKGAIHVALRVGVKHHPLGADALVVAGKDEHIPA